MAVKIILRHDTAANWTLYNPVMMLGEVGVETDTLSMKFGDGTSTWSALEYATSTPVSVQSLLDSLTTSDIPEGTNEYFTAERAQDAIGNALGNGLTYTDTTGAIAVDTSTIATNSHVDTLIGDVTVDGTSQNTITDRIASEVSGHALETSNIHGITGNVVGTTDVQTLTNKTLGAELNANDNKVTNLGTPTSDKDAATKLYVDTAVSGIVDGAPDLLNTLNELSAAINDDASFSSTIATSIGEKLPKSGGTMTGSLVLSGDPTLDYEAATKHYVNTELNDHDRTTDVHGISNTSDLAYQIDVTTAVSDHSNATTNIHGISDTADLVYKNNPTLTGNVTLPSTTTIGSVQPSEIEKLAGLTASTNELNILDGATVTVAELNTLDGITASTAELNTLDGILATTTELNKLSGVTTTTSELNTLSGITATVSELNTLDGITASVTELNTLDGITASVTELNTLDGITASVSELNILDGVTATASDLNILNGVVATTSEINTLSGLTANTNELNILDGITSSTSELNILSGVTATATELNTLDGITASTLELNILDGVTASTAELNYVDGVTSSIQAQLDDKASSTDLSTHSSTTTNVHGIADTSALETQTGSQNKANAAETAANGYTDTAISALDTNSIPEGLNLYFTDERAQDAVGSHVTSGLYYNDTTGAIGVTYNTGLTLDGFGKLVIDSSIVTTNSDNQTITNKTIDTADNNITVVVTDVSDLTASASELNTLDGITASTIELNYVDGVTSAIQTQLDGKAPLAGPTLTGTTHVTDLVIDGELTFSGTATTINSTNLEVTDSLIYLAAQQFDTDAIDIGMYGAYGDSNAGHFHTGLIRDASDGKWKLISGGDEPTSNVVDFTSVTYDTLKIGALEATSATIGNVSNTELQYLDGVTSALQTQLDAKAPLASPTFTGTVTLPDSTVTNAMLAGSITATKISGTAVTQADTGTVTSAMIADGTIVNEDISASAAIAVSKLAASTISGVTLGNNLNALTIGTGLTGTSYNGSGAVTVAIDSSVATLTGAQTLTNKTISLASGGATFSDGTVQVTAGVPSVTTISQKTNSYTLSSLTERDTIVEISSTSATTLTIPLDSAVNYPVGTTLDILQTNTGQVTIAGDAGVTVNATPGLKLRTRWSSATLLKRAANTWVVYGDLSA